MNKQETADQIAAEAASDHLVIANLITQEQRPRACSLLRQHFKSATEKAIEEFFSLPDPIAAIPATASEREELLAFVYLIATGEIVTTAEVQQRAKELCRRKPDSAPATPSEESVETLRSCRDHWKAAFEHEREKVIQLSNQIHAAIHGNKCICTICELVGTKGKRRKPATASELRFAEGLPKAATLNRPNPNQLPPRRASGRHEAAGSSARV